MSFIKSKNLCMRLSQIPGGCYQGSLSSWMSAAGFKTASQLLFKTTPCVQAEPIKSKAADPTLQIERLKKKKKKLVASIDKYLRSDRRLKPIQEIEGIRKIQKTLNQRQREENKRELTFEEQFTLEKEQNKFVTKWSAYHMENAASERLEISKALALQTRALNALREESEELFQLAVQPDPNLIPFSRSGPSYTPSIKGYRPPLGLIKDVSDKFDRSYADVNKEVVGKKSTRYTKKKV